MKKNGVYSENAKVRSELLASSFGGNTLRAQIAGWVFPATLRSIKYRADLSDLKGIILTFSTHWDPKKLTNSSTNVLQSTKGILRPKGEKKIDLLFS